MATKLKKMVLNELSFVDFGANVDSLVSIHKMRDEVNDMDMTGKTEIEKLGDTVAELTKKLTDAEAAATAATALVKKAEALAALSDVEKAYMVGMSDEASTAFMALSVDKRKDEIAVNKANDESLVVDGTVVTKSAVGAGTFAVLKSQQKRLDEQQADIVKAREATEIAVLTKRAGDDFSHLVGTDAERALVLKAMVGMAEPVRATLEAILKSAEAMVVKGFTPQGHTLVQVAKAGSASEELEVLAKAHADKHKVAYAVAYNEIITKRADLYERVIAEGV